VHLAKKLSKNMGILLERCLCWMLKTFLFFDYHYFLNFIRCQLYYSKRIYSIILLFSVILVLVCSSWVLFFGLSWPPPVVLFPLEDPSLEK